VVEGTNGNRLSASPSADRPVPRLLFLIDSLGQGGAELQARFLLTHLPKDRISARLACFGGDEEHLRAVEEAGVPIDLLRNTPRRLWPLRAMPAIHRIIGRHRIGIVQAFLPTFDTLAPCLRLLRSDLRVVTSRRNVAEQLTPARRRLLRMTRGLVTAIVGNSEAVSESVQRIERVAPERLRVIPNGIALPAPLEPTERAQARSRLGVEEDAFVVAYLAHFRTGKGHEHLPKLAEELLHTVPDARILVAGDMESNRYYRRHAAAFHEAIGRLGLERRVRTLGLLQDSRELLAAADASLSLSDVEGMSNAQMESMALGVPVVATDAGGTAELIEDGTSGWVVPQGAIEEAVAHLITLASDPELRKRVGIASRERIAAAFSVERMADRYAALYEELAAR
jgi:glycosyltransferase involved in cell wall biosynthesis